MLQAKEKENTQEDRNREKDAEMGPLLRLTW